MSKDIRGDFSSTSSSSLAPTSKDISESEDFDIELTVAKKQCHGLTSHQGSTSSKKRHYLKKWESEFQWLEYLQGAFCKHCKENGQRQTPELEEHRLLGHLVIGESCNKNERTW